MCNPGLSSKGYWSILKTFYNDKKIPVIPPLVVDNPFVSDFKLKADIFNNYFAKQCSLLNNSITSVLIGDSIASGLQRYPEVRKLLQKHGILNLGIGGNRTQHVLWRVEKLNLPNTLRYCIIHCGTNNLDKDTPEEIANAIILIGLLIKEKCNNAKIVITGLLPRDNKWSFRRKRIAEVNENLKNLCKLKNIYDENIFYMEQDSDWSVDDGNLNRML